MSSFFAWFTHLGNSKVFALVLFFSFFCVVIIYLYSSKSRGERLESYKNIPFQDEDNDEYKDSGDR